MKIRIFISLLCRDTTVKVDMVPFISRYQPDKLESWLKGRDFDLHPGKAVKEKFKTISV